MKYTLPMIWLFVTMWTTTVASAKVIVVSTTTDPAAIAAEIGADRISISALAKGYQDPHFLDSKPSYVVQLRNADLLLSIGLDLEIGYLPTILTGARNPKIVVGQPGNLDLSQVITPLEVSGTTDRGQGDVHPAGNPHYWLDPENGKLMARAIAARLAQLDPAGKELYQTNLAKFEQQLTEHQKDWLRRLAAYAGRPIVTYHRSWTYFATRYGLAVVGFVEPKPGIPPSPSHTLQLLELIKQKKVGVIVMENFYDRKVPDLIGSKTGAAVVSVPISVGGSPAVKTYADLFETIISELEKSWK